jgi:RND family efflux transporter MFP subunit
MDQKVDDKNVLLNQLRIDRTADDEDDGSTRRWVLIGVSVVLVAGLGAATWWFFTRPSGIPVAEAVAQEARGSTSAGGASTGASMLDASGYVVARRSATVASKSILRVVDVAIEEGQRVKEGQIIARLDDSNTRASLEQARAQVTQAEASLRASKTAFDDAQPIFKRNQRQLEAKVISEQAFDSARATYNASEQDYNVRMRALEVARATLAVAQRYQDDTIVRAPFSGVVVTKAAQAGEIVSPSSAGGGFTRTGICTIVDMDSLEVEVDVSENFINRVRPQQPATIKLNAYPDWEIPAEVIAVIPTADRSKATVKVRVAFKQKDERVLPEMGARVSFLSTPEAAPAGGAAPAAVRAVIIPAEAVQSNGDTGAVYVINGNVVERRVVRLGSKSSDGQLVLSGISSGTHVVVGNLDSLTDGAKVYVDPQAARKQGEGS